jgi:hypothetical protein
MQYSQSCSEAPRGMIVRQFLDQVPNRRFPKKTTAEQVRGLLQASSFVTEMPSTEMHGSIPTAKFKLRRYVPASPEAKALGATLRQGFRELESSMPDED